MRVRSWCRSRAGEGADALARHAERVHRLAGHQQRQRRIETAGDADGYGRLADVFQRLARPATCVRKISSQRSRSCLLARGTNGWASTSRARRCGGSARSRANGTRGKSTLHAEVKLGVAEAVGAQAVGAQAIQIDVGDQQVIVPLETARLGQENAVLGDQAMAAEDHVGGRFPDAAGGVDDRRRCSGRTG